MEYVGLHDDVEKSAAELRRVLDRYLPYVIVPQIGLDSIGWGPPEAQ